PGQISGRREEEGNAPSADRLRKAVWCGVRQCFALPLWLLLFILFECVPQPCPPTEEAVRAETKAAEQSTAALQTRLPAPRLLDPHFWENRPRSPQWADRLTVAGRRRGCPCPRAPGLQLDAR